ncbi:hypothetical protein EMPS_07787 [Entomortierella parvispora]|uniref:Uncharacterized protein n=1 Tax=Entomortierella parvispora TaxID=205924 RepID=A0A9P3LYP3_9FUNG|nr:hypothetical protein EMPS_07787 [Entomortierella parvispora]
MNSQSKNLRSSTLPSSQQAQGQRKNQQQQSSEVEQRSETPSHAGLSKIEAPMSGKKMCNHGYDCDCSTEAAIHASEEHVPKTTRTTGSTRK